MSDDALLCDHAWQRLTRTIDPPQSAMDMNVSPVDGFESGVATVAFVAFTRYSRSMPHFRNRRRTLRLFASAALNALVALPLGARAAAAPPNLSFRALRNGSPIGVHTVSFRQDGERLMITTRIDISVKVLLFTAFYFKHEAEEVLQAGRLVAVKSTTDDNGTRLQVSGAAVEGGFRITGEEGPFLAPGQLLTSNMLWDTRMMSADRLIDVQYGGVIGLAVKPLGSALVDTPHGQVRATRHHLITPHYTGTLFHDSSGRWVKALIEAKGEIIEYALAR